VARGGADCGWPPMACKTTGKAPSRTARLNRMWAILGLRKTSYGTFVAAHGGGGIGGC